MKVKMLIVFGVLAITIFSCRKNDDVSVTPAPVRDFTNLKVGNYWIYGYYKTVTSGDSILQVPNDTAMIIGEKNIEGKTYFIKTAKRFHFHETPDTVYIRDSAGYLMQYSGPEMHDVIIFSRDNFQGVVFEDENSIFRSEMRMTGRDSVVTVPAGEFVTRTSKYTLYPADPNYPWGIRSIFNIYGENAGLIKYNYGFWSEPVLYEARLVKFGKATK